jgi:hypothetical protein
MCSPAEAAMIGAALEVADALALRDNSQASRECGYDGEERIAEREQALEDALDVLSRLIPRLPPGSAFGYLRALDKAKAEDPHLRAALFQSEGIDADAAVERGLALIERLVQREGGR